MKFIYPIIAMALIATGCDKDDESGSIHHSDLTEARTTSVYYVCVGMEKSKRFGACPGCRLDSSRMDEFLKKNYGYPGVLLQSEQATRSSVVKELKKGVAQTASDGMFIFYYSGHGGQEDLSSWNLTEPPGADGMDEYLCLYDTYMLDDDLWDIISSCKGRVFCIFDCCHSQTMFRSVKSQIESERGLAVTLSEDEVRSSGFVFKPVALPMGTGSFRMLSWSGCLEKEYSYGSSAGGVLTNFILSDWKMGQKYDELWESVIKKVNDRQPGQHPVKTQYGSGFEEVFR